MSFSLSFEASVKIKAISEVKKLVHHTGRDVDERNGLHYRHSNELIDPGKTGRNITMFYDASSGKHRKAVENQQIYDALENRLGDVTGRKVQNPVILRGIILQLDPKWYEGKTERQKMKAANDMMAWAEKRFGKENLVYVSLHRDETNDHLHLGMCPVTADGRLAQKDWFGTPEKLRSLHDDFRVFMKNAGYDIEMSRKNPGKRVKRKSEREFKEFKEKEKALDARESDLKARTEALEAREVKCQALVSMALEALRMAEKERQRQGRDTADLDFAASNLVQGAEQLNLSL